MASIFSYRRITTPGPTGTTHYFRNADSEPRAIELGELDGRWYVSVPDGCELPEQPAEIEWEPVAMTADLREQLKAVARPLQLIAARTVERIRSQYSLDDELYFARIAVGALQGTYELRPGELDLLARYQSDVEAAREDAHMERLALGL